MEGSNGVQGDPVTGESSPHETKTRPLLRSRGKSSKEKSLMIRELKQERLLLKRRIAELEQKVIDVRKEKNNRLTKDKAREKVSEVREEKNKRIAYKNKLLYEKRNRVKQLTEELTVIKELKHTIFLLKNEVKREKARSDKFKATIYRIQGNRRRKKIIREKVKLSREEQRYKDIADKGIDVASYNVYVNTFRLVNFAKENHISVDLLSCMLQAHIEGSLITQRLKTGTRAILNSGIKTGVLSIQNVGATKHYYLTVKGNDMVLTLKKYIKRRKDLDENNS